MFGRLDAAALCADIRYLVPCGCRMGNAAEKAETGFIRYRDHNHP
jgi:hypothetical protein